jgi:CRISPR/Cas system CSM-associated protein Csm3 (group 7 of RAMP superfamily)
MTPVRARKVSWNADGTFKDFSNKYILIPASSVKGAIAHRAAFHYNKNTNATIENGKGTVGDDNPAIQSLFGYMKDGEPVQRGNVLISDVFEQEPNWDDIAKLINHVAIDRFTGGAIDGALFTEQTLYKKGQNFAIKLLVNETAFKDVEVKKAFFDTLDDISNGMLPLGGGVNRGNGIFSGSYEPKRETFFNEKEGGK